MEIQEHIKFWIESADDDLKVADNLYNSGNYNWCLFVGHLVLEKAFKANYIQTNGNKVPPKIHDLLKLAIKSNIALNDHQFNFFELVNRFCIAGRYIEYKQEITKFATKEKAFEILESIKKEFEWLKSLIKY
ncbi:MAG: HEPN domain-containing protein [bacterium]